jgi:hypothetical protein
MSEIYQLSEFQNKSLSIAANGKSICFAILESSDSDPQDTKEKLDKDFHEIEDLVRLELVKDVSEKFTEQIQLSRINNGRGYKVVALTEVGLRMFANAKKRLVQ